MTLLRLDLRLATCGNDEIDVSTSPVSRSRLPPQMSPFPPFRVPDFHLDLGK